MADKILDLTVLGWSFAGWRRFVLLGREDGRTNEARVLCFGAKAAELHHALDQAAKTHLNHQGRGEQDPGRDSVRDLGLRLRLTGFWRKAKSDDAPCPGSEPGPWVFVATAFALEVPEPLHLKLARQRAADEAARLERKAANAKAFTDRWHSTFGGAFSAHMDEAAQRLFDGLLGDDVRRGGQGSTALASPSLRAHLDALGLDALPAGESALQAAYRTAMKRFHPDCGTEPDSDRAKAANIARDELARVLGL